MTNMTTFRRLTGGYFGTRRADFFPAPFMDRIKDKTMFSDITAGTGQFPYRVATELEMPLLLLERCPYVGYFLKAIFAKEGTGCPTDPQSARISKQGYLSNLLTKNEKYARVFNPDTAGWIDAVASGVNKDPLLLYALGRAIVRLYSFRGRNLCLKQANGVPTYEITPAHLAALMEKTLFYALEMREAIKVQCQVHIGDSTELLPTMDPAFVKGGTVYADPAWPWAKGMGSATDNPYVFFSEDISSILEQKDLTTPSCWTRETGKDAIFANVKKWIDSAFELGADQFIVCTQDTNFPSIEEAHDFLLANFDLQTEITIQDWSASANRNYTNIWFFINR